MKTILKLSMIIFIVLSLLGSFFDLVPGFILAVTYFGLMGTALTAGYLIYDSLKNS